MNHVKKRQKPVRLLECLKPIFVTVRLIYIDPPFAVGADFGFNIEIGGEPAEKKQSIIEEIACRDTWGKGISSYLSMMYERLKLMHNLLAESCQVNTKSWLRRLIF